MAVVVSSDGKLLASASSDGTIKLWDIQSASSEGMENLWNTQSSEALQTLIGCSDWVMTMTFSFDGNLLASTSKTGMFKLWDVQSGATIQTLEGHSAPVTAVAFSPDDRLLLASASRDKTVKLWDTESGLALQTFEVDNFVQDLSFSDDGTFLQSDRGPLCSDFLSRGIVVSQPSFPPSLFLKEQWISYGVEKILWLPSEYRLSCVAIYGNIIAFSYLSDRV